MKVSNINKDSRPRANDMLKHRYQWRFARIPKTIKYEGNENFSNPFRESAIFVVHGIGEQQFGDTAIALRKGIEDAVPAVEPKYWDSSKENFWVVPQPFIWDANWAKYYDFDVMEPDAKKALSPEDLEYFRKLWLERSVGKGAARSVLWLIRSSFDLFVKDRSLIGKFVYGILAVIVIIISCLMLIHSKSRTFLKEYANDARLYLSPKGDIENHIVQKIEHSIGEQFLELLGIDWNFDPLKTKKVIDNEEHEFKRVTWVAHSLGSVISFNVISDLLKRCVELRESSDNNIDKVKKVEKALSSFITLGSPLDKVAHLYSTKKMLPENSMFSTENSVLRPWPKKYLPGGEFSQFIGNSCPYSGEKEPFWYNFYYRTDPVSGSLELFSGNAGCNSSVKNIRTKGWRLPIYSHVAYWSDQNILTKIVEKCFLGFTKKTNSRISFRKFWPFSIR